MNHFHRRLTTLLIGGFVLLSLPLIAQSPVAVETSAAGLNFQTDTGFDRLLVTVGGPDDLTIQQEFSAGSSLFFSLADQNLPDGLYTYEVKLVHEPTQGVRAQLERLRDAGTSVSLSAGAIASGHFTIEGQQIVLDRPEAIDTKDQVFIDDLIVDGSACVGTDCANGENFGFDTLRLKENNLRIKFDDTSSSGSFPKNDWQLTANDSSNGGAEYFSIDDVTNSKTPFKVEAGADNNNLYVEADGDVGIKTANPVVDLHIVEGNTPTLRLEQDGSDGFSSHIWDVAGNETNFFIRDVTSSSKLPFRIKPGAPTDSIFVAASGNVGLGTDNPADAALQIVDTATTSTTQMLRLEANSQPRFTMVNNSGSQTWHQQVTTSDDTLAWISAGSTNTAMTLDPSGNLVIQGTITTAGLVTPDYVFEDDYELMTLEEVEAFIQKEKHLPKVPSAKEIAANGLNISDMQNRLLEKVEELTLYTIDQQKMIAEQQQMIDQLQQRLGLLEGEEIEQN